MNERLRRFQTSPLLALEQQRRALAAQGARVFDFATADAVEPTPPAIRAALRDGVPAAMGYPDVHGLADLRAAAAGYLQRRFGVAVDPEREVLPTLGSREAVFHLPMVLVQVPSDKDLVLYGEPAWPVYEASALFAEAWTYAMPLTARNGYLMDPELVPEATLRRAAVVFLNYPHNPTGQSLPPELFRAWVVAREQFGFTLVSDECYADVYYESARPQSLLEFGRRGCLVAHSTSTRSGMTGYRSGFLAGDAELLAHYARYRAAMGTVPQEFVQRAAAVAWRDDAHVEARRRAFVDKRRVLLAHFARRGLEVYPGTAGPFLWLAVPAGSNDVEYAARCRERGILVLPGSVFGPRQERFVRIAFSPSLGDCEAAVAAWPA